MSILDSLFGEGDSGESEIKTRNLERQLNSCSDMMAELERANKSLAEDLDEIEYKGE